MFRFSNTPRAWRYEGQGYKREFYLDVWLRDVYEKHFSELFSHQVFGYTMRVLAAGSVGAITYLTGKRLFLWTDEGKPLYERLFQRWVPVTFVDRTQEGNSDVWVYRFALPNSFDYTGHPCFSSCKISCGQVKRHYTPINNPAQRGIIEFAVKHYDPGEMSQHLRSFMPGETCHVGGWLKEMKYTANKYDHLGFIAGNSGITPFLQLLTCSLADPDDKTRFSLLYANYGPHVIPFKQKLLSVAEKFPERVKVDFICQSLNDKRTDGDEVVLPRASAALTRLGQPQSTMTAPEPTGATIALLSGMTSPSGLIYDDTASKDGTAVATAIKAPKGTFIPGKDGKPEPYEGYVGMIDRNVILETMPHPDNFEEERRKILVCGPARMLGNLCGRPVPIWRTTYIEGMYDGVLKQLGYKREMVYKFGYTWHQRGLDT